MNDSNAKRLLPKRQLYYLKTYYSKYMVGSFCQAYLHSSKRLDTALALVNPKTRRSIFLVLLQRNKGIKGKNLTTAKVDLSQGIETRCLSHKTTLEFNNLITKAKRIRGRIRPIHKLNNLCIGPFVYYRRGPKRTRVFAATRYRCYAYRHKSRRFVRIGGWVYR